MIKNLKHTLQLALIHFSWLIVTCAMGTTNQIDNLDAGSSYNSTHLIAQLNKEGVKVQDTGYLTIILATDKLFVFPYNTVLQPTQVAILNNITQLIQLYGNPTVIVSAHTDNVGSAQAKLNRSLAQARTITAYLWSEGIPQYRLIAIGCGDTKPVASSLTIAGSDANRRIEIQIRKKETD